MQLFDSHCHLDDEKFDLDRAEAIARMREAGVTRCTCVGSDLPSSRRCLDLAQQYDFIYAAAGVHPHEAKDAPASSALAELRSSLDESWRSGTDAASRFDLFRSLPDDSRAAWLGYVVARSLEASLNMSGERQLPFQDHLGSLIGIDMAQ